MFRTNVVKVKDPWVDKSGERPVLHPEPVTIWTKPLTPQAFAPFGSVVEDPEYPHHPPRQSPLPKPIPANQGTARKYTNVSPVVNKYDKAPSGQAATLQMTYFACEPRDLEILSPKREAFFADERAPDSMLPHGIFRISIMERHPFTTQTFAPMGLADTITPAQTKGWPREQDLGTGYLVIVAPTIKTAAGEEIPDIKGLKAFLANGRQAVTYGASVWHSPMVVVGKEVVGFLVTQWTNGVSQEDCEEINIEAQQLINGSSIQVVVKGFEGHHRREERL